MMLLQVRSISAIALSTRLLMSSNGIHISFGCEVLVGGDCSLAKTLLA